MCVCVVSCQKVIDHLLDLYIYLAHTHTQTLPHTLTHSQNGKSILSSLSIVFFSSALSCVCVCVCVWDACLSRTVYERTRTAVRARILNTNPNPCWLLHSAISSNVGSQIWFCDSIGWFMWISVLTHYVVFHIARYHISTPHISLHSLLQMYHQCICAHLWNVSRVLPLAIW